jgi:hypothetical protein
MLICPFLIAIDVGSGILHQSEVGCESSAIVKERRAILRLIGGQPCQSI